MTYEMHCQDALELMATLPVGSIDAIITDLPYGVTNCAWDAVIPFAPMWEQVKRVLKPRGVFVTTASQPFTTRLIASNFGWFKYELIWDKSMSTGFLNAAYMPMKAHENILIFAADSLTYNPQMIKRSDAELMRLSHQTKVSNSHTGHVNHVKLWCQNRQDGEYKYPNSLVRIGALLGSSGEKQSGLHPTQKPVALYAYLIRTYTNPGDTVLDFCMGSGTTGCAAVKEGRNFIGNDSDAGYVAIATRRLQDAAAQPSLFAFEVSA